MCNEEEKKKKEGKKKCDLLGIVVREKKSICRACIPLSMLGQG